MKYLVTYYSQTGNTRKIAEAIFEALPGEKNIKPFDELNNLNGFDLIFIGFPIMQFGPPSVAIKFIDAFAANKKIALFVTHAALSDSDDPKQKSMLDRELEKCRSACSKSELIGLFHCQGELSEKMANELINSGLPMLMEFAGMQPLTKGYPGPNEMKMAMGFAKEMILTAEKA